MGLRVEDFDCYHKALRLTSLSKGKSLKIFLAKGGLDTSGVFLRMQGEDWVGW